MQSLWMCSLLFRARNKLLEVVSLFTEFHVYHDFISITSFSLISVFTSLILVLINVLNNFNSVCCFYSVVTSTVVFKEFPANHSTSLN